jgi:predicted enzyme related to lactoylglutathione lyase
MPARIWTELRTNDPAGARSFYGALFGWRFDGPTAYLGDGVVAGIVAAEPAVPPMWTTFFVVDDVAATVTAVADAGGAGSTAVVSDPTGAVVGLRQGDPRGGAPAAGGPGTAAWHELLTSDVDAAVGFYRRVFGLTPEAVELSGQPWHVLKAGADLVAGVVPKPSADQPPGSGGGTGTAGGTSSAPAGAPAAGTYSASTPGLYGGTMNNSSCDRDRMLAFLKAHPDKGREWARVVGVATRWPCSPSATGSAPTSSTRGRGRTPQWTPGRAACRTCGWSSSPTTTATCSSSRSTGQADGDAGQRGGGRSRPVLSGLPPVNRHPLGRRSLYR